MLQAYRTFSRICNVQGRGLRAVMLEELILAQLLTVRCQQHSIVALSKASELYFNYVIH